MAVAASLALLAGAATAQAAAPASAPASAARKELVARLVKLHQPAVEALSRTLVEQPAQQMGVEAQALMARLPRERRDALVRELDTDLRKYFDEALPIVRERALALSPVILGPALEQRFSEDELKQLVALLESPLNAKYQAFRAEIQRPFVSRLYTETRGAVEPKVKALEQSVGRRLRSATAATGAASTASSAR